MNRPQGQWKFRNRLPIQDKMENVVKLTMAASERELEVLRRKLRKMRLGS